MNVHSILSGRRPALRGFMREGIHGFGAIDKEQFEKLLHERLPGVAQTLTDLERSLLHLEMAAFARATRAAIDCGDHTEVRAHLNFLDELFSDSAPDVKNAVYVSYLENVFPGERSADYLAARAVMSERLRLALIELEDHWMNLAEYARSRPGSDSRS